MSGVIGPIVGGDTVGDAVLAQLKLWMPTYLAEISRQRGLPADTLPPVASWDLLSPGQRLIEWKSPAVAVSPMRIDRIRGGIAARIGGGTDPDVSADQTLSVGMLVTVNFLVESTDHQATFRLAARYAAAGRATLLQHPRLDGLSKTIELVEEGFQGLQTRDKSRFQGGAAVAIRVHINDAMRVRPDGLEIDPPADPLTGPPDAPEQTSSVIFTELA